MSKDEIEGGASEFLLNFDALLKANKEEEMKSVSLKSVRNALETEIKELVAKKTSLEVQIKEDIAQCSKEISIRKEQAERNFETERIRLANLSRQLEEQKVDQGKIETTQRQRESELNERERLLNEKDIGFNHKEVDLKAKEEQIKKDYQTIAFEKNENKRNLQSVNDQLYGIEQTQQGIKDNLNEFKKQQLVLREAEVKLENKAKEVEAERLKNVEDKQELATIREQLSKDQNQVNASLNILSKQKKDNEDKEAALKAMKIDLDFKIAKLKMQK